MSKRRARPNTMSPTTAEVLAPEGENVISTLRNGLSDVIGFGSGNPFGTQIGSEQISQPTTIFRNLRWYLVSNFRQVLSEAYMELGLIQTVCSVPVEDALRGGIEISSKELSPEQIEELQISIDRDDDLGTLGQAGVWNRLFGGAAVLILTDQDPFEELDLDSIDPDEDLQFRALDMWELFWDKQNAEGYDPTIQSEDFTHYNYYGEQIHKSRVLRLKGLTAPSFIRPRLRGWGFSVVEILVRSINQYLKATDLGFEVLDEFKVDIYKIKNLVMSLMTPEGENAVKRRIQLANYQKNYQNAVVMDSEDDWDHKQLSFAGLAEAMAGIRMQVASDLRMPLTKIFGISATGFNSGEDDIEVYNSMVESQVRVKLKPVALKMVEVKCAKLFGMVPQDLVLSWKPLRVLSSEQEENVKTQKFTRLTGALQAGAISHKTFIDSCNKDNLLGVKIDADEIDEDFSTGDDEDDEGEANKFDSQKGKATPKGDAKASPDTKEPKDPARGSQKVNPGAKIVKPKTVANADDWDESKHPRADDGKFGSGGGGEVHHSTHEKFSAKDIKPSKGGYFGEGFYVHRDKGATLQYGDKTHTYKLADKPVFDVSGAKLKPETIDVFKEMGLDVDAITTPSQFRAPMQIAISEIRKKFPGDETVGKGAMEKLRSFLKEKGYAGIQFSHNDTDENMVIFDKKDLSPGSGGSKSATGKKKKPLSSKIKVTAEEKKIGQAFIMKTLDPGKVVAVTNPTEHKIAERLVADGLAEVVGKKNYGRIEKIRTKAEEPLPDKGSGGKTAVSGQRVTRDKAVSGDTETKQLVQETKPVFDALAKSEPALIQGIKSWSTAAYAYVRDIQRKGKTEHGADAQKIGESVLKVLDENFSKLPAYSGPLVRDVSLDLDEVQSIYAEGSEHVLDAYTSFTARDTYLTRRKVRLQIDRSEAGRAAWGACQDPGEAEVIVPKGVKYRVKKIEERDEAPYVVVHLEELK